MNDVSRTHRQKIRVSSPNTCTRPLLLPKKSRRRRRRPSAKRKASTTARIMFSSLSSLSSSLSSSSSSVSRSPLCCMSFFFEWMDGDFFDQKSERKDFFLRARCRVTRSIKVRVRNAACCTRQKRPRENTNDALIASRRHPLVGLLKRLFLGGRRSRREERRE